MTRKLSLDATARELLDAAGRSTAQRASHTVVGGHEHIKMEVRYGETHSL